MIGIKASRRDLTLAFAGFVQVFMVSTNVVFVANGSYLLAFMTSLLLSYAWARNVSRISLGVERDRWLYATGAATGCFVGMVLARLLLGGVG